MAVATGLADNIINHSVKFYCCITGQRVKVEDKTNNFTDKWTNGCLYINHRWLDGWMDGWTDRQMGGWASNRMHPSIDYIECLIIFRNAW